MPKAVEVFDEAQVLKGAKIFNVIRWKNKNLKQGNCLLTCQCLQSSITNSNMIRRICFEFDAIISKRSKSSWDTIIGNMKTDIQYLRFIEKQ